MTPRSNFSTDTRRVIMAFSKDRFLSKSRFDSNVELKRLFVGIAVPFQRVIGFLQESMDSFDRVNRLFHGVNRPFHRINRLFNRVNKES